MKGYHFIGERLRDGSPVPPDGKWIEVGGPIELCTSGLHFSRHPLDALNYAPGSILCSVEVEGDIHYHDDKGVARRRRIIDRIDATDVLRRFARLCALDVIHLWDAPEVVIQHLKSGDDSIRAATAGAARDAANAAWAAESAADSAADAAAWAAAGAAAGAAGAAGAAWAAWAAETAAAYVAWAAASAAESATAAGAAAAAWAAARGKQRRRFSRMVRAEFKK